MAKGDLHKKFEVFTQHPETVLWCPDKRKAMGAYF